MGGASPKVVRWSEGGEPGNVFGDSEPQNAKKEKGEGFLRGSTLSEEGRPSETVQPEFKQRIGVIEK